MYGGNNYNRSTYHNDNATFNQYSKQMRQEQMGSFRVNDYHSDKVSKEYECDVQAFKKKSEVPYSICSRLETLTIAPVELRIEDYYLMREEKVPHHVADRIKEAARKNCFNPEIIQRKMGKPKSAALDVFKDIDALKEFVKKKSGNNYPGLNWAGSSPRDTSKDNKGSYEGRSNNIFGNSSSNNIVSRNGQGYGGSSGGNKPDNVFMNTRTQGGGLFDNHPGGGTSGNGSGGGNQGIFSRGYGTIIGGSDNNRVSGGSGNNNIFGKGGQGTGGGTSGNIFSNQNTGSSNTGNKIFGNTGSSNTNTNIFGANNSNNSGNNTNDNSNNRTGNLFSNQNQGGSNQTNIFGNNQNNNSQNTNKIFTNNNSNNNNIFNNQNNQNNNNNNIFSNSNNNNNNLFNNNQNNSNQGKPSIPPQLNQFISHMSGIMQETQLMMLNIVNSQQQQFEQEKRVQREEENLFQHENPLNKMFSFDEDDFPSYTKKDRPRNQIFIMQPTPKRHQYPGPTIVQRYPREEERSKLGKTAHSRIRQQTQHGSNMRSQTIRQGSHHFSQKGMSYRMGYTCRDGSIAPGQTIDLNKKLICRHSCKVDLEFQINWIIKQSERIELPKLLKETIQLDYVDLESEEGRQEVCRILKERRELGIRSDAVIKIDKKRCANNPIIIISGKIEQKLVNIGEDYDYFFNGEKNGKLQNFTIMRQNIGSIAWDYPIPYLNLDFQNGNDFSIEDNEFQVEQSELKGPCRITFFTLPKDISWIRSERGIDEARSALRSRINKKDGGMQFLDLWESGSWCFKFPRGIE